MGQIIGILWAVALISSVFKAISSAKSGSRGSSRQAQQRSYSQQAARPIQGQAAPASGREKVSSIRENGLLLEDRKNDWLAKQMREEAEIYRRGSLYDLGAAHEADCDARRIKLFHVMTHNSNGVDKKTFE